MSRSGWVVSNTVSSMDDYGTKTYKLAVLNSAQQPMGLGDAASGWFFPVHISELPGGKVAVSAGKSSGETSRIYLSGGENGMTRATRLSENKIRMFAGDGTGMTSEGEIWRNGEVLPLRDLCDRYGELADEGWNFWPLKANTGGAYLMVATNGEGEAEAKVAVPTELSLAVGNNLIPAATEDTVGGSAVLNFDDDDKDAGAWGHGQTLLQPDFEDINGVVGENDMLRLAVKKMPMKDIAYRLKYDDTNIKIWKSVNKGGVGEIMISDSTGFTVEGDWKEFHVEGIKPHDSPDGTIVTLRFKPPGGVWQDGDTVKVRVARPVLAIYGDVDLWAVDRTILNGFLSARAGEDKTSKRTTLADGLTYVIPGKSQEGADVCYSVTGLTGYGSPTTPSIAEKFAKMAMQTEHMNLSFSGHCNYGVGLALGSNFNSFDQFFNMAGGGLASISRNDFGATHHPPMVIRFPNLDWNIAAINDRNNRAATAPLNRYLQGPGVLPNIFRYPHVGTPTTAQGQPFQTQLAAWSNLDVGGVVAEGTIKWHHIAHPDLDGNGPDDSHTILNSGDADEPANLRYRSLMINQCNSYRSFVESVRHGVVIASMCSVSSHGTTTKFVEGVVEGWDWNRIDTELDDAERPNIDPTTPDPEAFQITNF